jgi:hypothetical protein
LLLYVLLTAGAEVLLARSKSMVLPKNPLDDLIDRLGGPNQVRYKLVDWQCNAGCMYHHPVRTCSATFVISRDRMC